MTEDPEIIRLNILHYQDLLKLHSTRYTHDQIRRLLAEAQRQLPLAVAEAAARKQRGLSADQQVA